MNVAVVELASVIAEPSTSCERGSEEVAFDSEWIDPEGDDWLSSIYRELTNEPARAAVDRYQQEIDHWFG